MNKNVNIAIVGLGQIGIYLYNELKIKKSEIQKKLEKKLRLLLFLLKIKIRKDDFPYQKKFFTKIL